MNTRNIIRDQSYEGSDGNVRQLGLAVSRDGINWKNYVGNPVLRAGPGKYDQFVAGHGSLLHERGLYKLWYHAIGNLDSDDIWDASIAYATSTDGIHWNKHGTVLPPVPDGWDTGLWGPSVLKVNGSYWMWYTAAGWESPIAIGLAASPDGVSWSRVGDAPVLVNPQGTHQFSDPHVIRDAGMFKMWVGNFTDSVIYYAESPDGVDWSEPIPALLPGTR